MKEFNLDAKDQKLGRLATEIATILMGKNDPDYQPNKVADVKVNVSNVSLLDIDAKKKAQKVYDSYSGYPGGRKEITLGELIEKKGFAEPLKNAVYGMLPKNKLRDVLMKNLNITE
ncbi:50S ribosomal protein L13 [Candidatus Campbellbacteria bacterium]|nr:MAG: 50S ribosomal protein L13 [Candidatus Campbellbacteria bacterium]